MTRRAIDHTDPTQLAVQVSLRMPFWYRAQLMKEAHDANTTVPLLCLDAIERVYKPAPPK